MSLSNLATNSLETTFVDDLTRAEQLIKECSYAEALSALRRHFSTTRPTFIGALMSGYCSEQLGKLKQAEAFYSFSETLVSGQSDLTALCERYLSIGTSQKLLSLLKKFPSFSNPCQQLYFAMASEKFGNLSDAAEAIAKIPFSKLDSAFLRRNYLVCAKNAGCFEEFLSAIELLPEEEVDGELLGLRIEIELGLGMVEVGIAHYEQVKHKLSGRDSWTLRAHIARATAETEGFIGQVKDAIECGEADPHLLRMLADSYTSLCRWKEAEAVYGQLVRDRDRSCADDIINFALVRDRLGLGKEALTLIRSLKFDEDTKDRTYLNARGMLEAEYGDRNQAEILFRHSIRNVDDFESKYNLSLLLLENQLTEEAWELYESRLQYSGYGGIGAKTKQLIEKFALPRWTDRNTSPDHLIILTEQGIGEDFFFLRWIVHLKRDSFKSVTYVPNEKLYTLFKLFEDKLGIEIRRGEDINPESGASYVFAGTLPHILKKPVGVPLWEVLPPGFVKEKILGNNDVLSVTGQRVAIASKSKNAALAQLKTIDSKFLQQVIREQTLCNGTEISLVDFDDIQFTEKPKPEPDMLEVAKQLMTCREYIGMTNSIVHLCGFIGMKTTSLYVHERALIWYWRRETKAMSPGLYKTVRLKKLR